MEAEVWVAPEVGKHLAVRGAQNNTSVQAWLLFVEHLLCARHLGELFKHMISSVTPTLRDEVAREETSSLSAEPLHMPLHWRNSG